MLTSSGMSSRLGMVHGVRQSERGDRIGGGRACNATLYFLDAKYSDRDHDDYLTIGVLKILH